MTDHTPVLFNVFEDWDEESVVLHICSVSLINYWLLKRAIRFVFRRTVTERDRFEIRFERKRPIRTVISWVID